MRRSYEHIPLCIDNIRKTGVVVEGQTEAVYDTLHLILLYKISRGAILKAYPDKQFKDIDTGNTADMRVQNSGSHIRVLKLCLHALILPRPFREAGAVRQIQLYPVFYLTVIPYNFSQFFCLLPFVFFQVTGYGVHGLIIFLQLNFQCAASLLCTLHDRVDGLFPELLFDPLHKEKGKEQKGRAHNECSQCCLFSDAGSFILLLHCNPLSSLFCSSSHSMVSESVSPESSLTETSFVHSHMGSSSIPSVPNTVLPDW